MNSSNQGKYGHLIVDELKYEPPMSPEYREIYNRFSHRQLWIDGNIVPGAFQMNTAWYVKTPEKDPIFEAHSHESEEIIGFFSSDPDSRELDSELEVIIDGESHIITRSALIFVPSGLPHSIRIHRIGKPIFHFSVVTGKTYNNSAYK